MEESIEILTDIDVLDVVKMLLHVKIQKISNVVKVTII